MVKTLRASFLVLLMAVISCQDKSRSTDETNKVAASIDPRKSVVCFLYHRFDDARFPSTNTSTVDFEAHLRYLKENGFTVLAFSDAMDYLHSDEPMTKVAVITVDDGYKSFYERALPILKKYDMPATLFVNTETVGAVDYMSWEELKTSIASGIEVGNHTHSHSYFMNEPAPARYDAFEADIMKSGEIMLERLGITPDVFAYPYGEFDKDMKRVVEETGFRYAAAQHSGVAHAGTDPYQIPRFPMSEAYASLAGFAEKASMRPLKIISQEPEDTLLPDPRPLLRLTLLNEGLQTNRMQCFVQGGDCEFEINKGSSGEIVVTLRAAHDLSRRRRTMYTVTVPDSMGAWHWYSHLWINPDIPG